MRTHEEINLASLKIVGTYACFIPGARYICCVNNDDMCIEYREEFAEFSDEDQDTILYHEAGHIVAKSDEKSVNARLYTGKAWPYRYSKLYDMAECEADLYAAQQIGLTRL